MSWTEAVWQAALVAVLLFGMARIAQAVIQAGERSRRDSPDVLNSSYPIFSESRICQIYLLAVAASRELREAEEALSGDSKFKESANRHSIPHDIADRMLDVANNVTAAEKRWYEHSVMMDANISVLTGQANRDEALARALQRFDAMGDVIGMDAIKLRDEWKARLEDPKAPVTDPSPRKYSNPWEARARSHSRF